MDKEQEYLQYLQSEKWRNIVQKRLEIDNYHCVMCGCMGSPVNPLNCHHMSYRYLYHEEQRIYEDLVTVCKSCHTLVHNLMNRVTNEDGRRGWADRSDLPQVFTFTAGGRKIESGEIRK